MRANIYGTAKVKLTNGQIELVRGCFDCDVTCDWYGDLQDIDYIETTEDFEPIREDIDDWNGWEIEQVIDIEEVKEYELEEYDDEDARYESEHGC